jgi:hypothetical protein
MAHFARITADNIVDYVIVINNDDAPGDFPDSELIGQQFIANLGLKGIWLQTSYNNNFRGRFAGIGHTYDPAIDEFVPPTPTDE